MRPHIYSNFVGNMSKKSGTDTDWLTVWLSEKQMHTTKIMVAALMIVNHTIDMIKPNRQKCTSENTKYRIVVVIFMMLRAENYTVNKTDMARQPTNQPTKLGSLSKWTIHKTLTEYRAHDDDTRFMLFYSIHYICGRWTMCYLIFCFTHVPLSNYGCISCHRYTSYEFFFACMYCV